MADETPPPPGASGQPERRRPAPTIDLRATEIASDPVAAAASGPEQASPSHEPLPDQDTAPEMPPKSALHRSLSGLAAGASWPLVGIALAGVILTLGIAWVVASSIGSGNDAGATDTRIAQLERQVADLAGRANASAANSASGSDLANRLQKLEAQIGQMSTARPPAADPALANRIAAAETQLKSLNETVGALRQRGDSNAAANAAALSELNQKLARAGTAESNQANEAAGANAALIAALTNRVDALEGSAKTIEGTLAAELANRQKETADDRSVRTAVVAAALAAAVERGGPFSAELEAAQAQAADAKALAPLEAFAAAGVPAADAFARELSSLEPALLRAAGTAPSEGGFLEKLQVHAERLVRIRPIEEAAGDDPAAVIARVEIKAGRGDLSGALQELGKLPAPVRAPAQAWIDKAQARAAAIAASRAFAADALMALAKPSH
jgi:hypothetical protein